MSELGDLRKSLKYMNELRKHTKEEEREMEKKREARINIYSRESHREIVPDYTMYGGTSFRVCSSLVIFGGSHTYPPFNVGDKGISIFATPPFLLVKKVRKRALIDKSRVICKCS